MSIRRYRLRCQRRRVTLAGDARAPPREPAPSPQVGSFRLLERVGLDLGCETALVKRLVPTGPRLALRLEPDEGVAYVKRAWVALRWSPKLLARTPANGSTCAPAEMRSSPTKCPSENPRPRLKAASAPQQSDVRRRRCIPARRLCGICGSSSTRARAWLCAALSPLAPSGTVQY